MEGNRRVCILNKAFHRRKHKKIFGLKLILIILIKSPCMFLPSPKFRSLRSQLPSKDVLRLLSLSLSL